MEKRIIHALITLCLILSTALSQQDTKKRSNWVTGYVPSWTLHMGNGTDGNYGNMPYKELDLDAVTHVVMFAVAINADGTIKFNNLVPSRRKKFNDHVHSQGKPVILSMGGAGNDAFSSALQNGTRTQLIKNVIEILQKEEYDGLDIDIEGFKAKDTVNLSFFVREVFEELQRHTAFYDRTKKPILTAAVYNYEKFWAGLSPYFDQINLMSYDMFGTWFGKSWHNNAPYGGPADVDQYGAVMTTVQSKMNRFLNAGIPREKFGVGVDFNGYVWKGGMLADGSGNGITRPRQRWNTPPKNIFGKETQYYKLRKNYIDRAGANLYYDHTAKVPYIGIDSAGNEADYFITFQDTTTIREIFGLAAQSDIGGVIIWEIGGGYLGEAEFSKNEYPHLIRDPLLQAVKRSMLKYFSIPSRSRTK